MNKNRNTEIFNWELLAVYLNNEATSQQKIEVENWLNQSEKNRDDLKKNRLMLNKIDGFYKTRSFDSIAAFKNVHSKISPSQLTVVRNNRRTKQFARFYKYAAIIVVALFLGGVGYYVGFKYQMPSIFNQIVSAEKQVLIEYVLPDGSVVALNSNSKLKFPKHFASDVREVTIIGEAFFDIKPNPDKPFIVNAGNTQVKVLGTSFNVCAYPETETIEVVVETGKVQVTRKSEDLLVENSKVFLIPGEKGTLFYKSNFLKKSVNTNKNFLAWKTNHLVFDETPLTEVIRCLEKVYHIEIQLTEPELENLVLTAHFDKKPVDFILDVVRLTFNLELTGENKHFALASRTKEQVTL